MKRIEADWIAAPEPQALCRMLTKAGHQAFFVGGCVRNALLGTPISDIDIATDARPDRVVALARAAGFKPVPTGFAHGTITVVVGGHAFEVTTFRRDVETDGRRAVVAYADTPEEDAHRRDFTMNALFATPDGSIVDPLGGLEDLARRHVRFIDNADERIREDYLRILRFFRFHAWYGDPEDGLNPEGLAACATNLAGLETLSRERVGQEMKKLLSAPDPSPSVAAMALTGVLAQVLPGASPEALPVLVHLEAGAGVLPDPMRRLACLGGEGHQERLRLSRREAKALDVFLGARSSDTGAGELGYRHGAGLALDALLVRSALLGGDLPPEAVHGIATGAAARFPVAASDLSGRFSGPALGRELKAREARWIDSGFTLTREELLP